MDKQDLIAQLADRLRETSRTARAALEGALVDGREAATPAEQREDARVALESAGLARGHRARLATVAADLAALERFRPAPIRGRVALGAIVEVEDDAQGRTFFLAPVGAGVELTGPGGDGYLSVVTPSSPVGRAVLGRAAGDTVEVVVQGEPREWTITYVG